MIYEKYFGRQDDEKKVLKENSLVRHIHRGNLKILLTVSRNVVRGLC